METLLATKRSLNYMPSADESSTVAKIAADLRPSADGPHISGGGGG